MDTRAQHPWLALFDAEAPAEIEPEHRNGAQMFAAAVRGAGDRPAIRYFDSVLTWRDVDALSDALAVALGELGVVRGERVAVYLQNVPQFVLATVATWKLGAIVVPVNPMYRERELEELLVDSGAVALVALESLYGAVAAAVVERTPVRAVVTTSELDFLDGAVPE
ncbi:MAG: long-chain acyl-CoA synthetase, partial [Solirubrobacteraceae bacterium]|nr:long-chain acyl-CoA synthetase [Solirubrobacteraceae bacterium]